MIFFKDKMTHKFHMLFPEDFFEPVPTKNDLVWGNHLDCLRDEWFVVLFDRLAYLQYLTLPQRMNRQNAVDPVYNATLKALTWPDKEEWARRLKVPRKKAFAKMASIDTDSTEVGPSLSGSSTLAQVSLTLSLRLLEWKVSMQHWIQRRTLTQTMKPTSGQMSMTKNWLEAFWPVAMVHHPCRIQSFNYRYRKIETCPMAHDNQETQTWSSGTH